MPQQSGNMDKNISQSLLGSSSLGKDQYDMAHAPMTATEEKELLRVFNLLTNYHSKYKIKQEIHELEAWMSSSKQQNQHPETSAINLLTGNLRSAEEMMLKSERRLEDLKNELSSIECKSDQKILLQDIMDMYKFLKKKISKLEAEEMLWEVDEDLDNAISWAEFKLMFSRNITDKTGLEPSRLFNLAQYLMYDHNENGHVSVDGTMHMLYARYGRKNMETKLKELFGEDMHETGREGGEITFSKYLNAVENIQLQTFYSTTKGKIALEKDTYKMSLDIHTEDTE